MKLNKSLQKNLDIFDKVLLSLGERKLLENENFQVSYVNDVYLKVKSIAPGTVSLNFEISQFDLIVNIEGKNEVFAWSIDEQGENVSEIQNILLTILTGNATVWNIGKNYMKVKFKVEESPQIIQKVIFDGLVFNFFQRTERKFPPILKNLNN